MGGSRFATADPETLRDGRWSIVGGLADPLLPIVGTDALSTARHVAARQPMTHASGRMMPDVTRADLPAISFRDRLSFVPLLVLSTLARMDANTSAVSKQATPLSRLR